MIFGQTIVHLFVVLRPVATKATSLNMNYSETALNTPSKATYTHSLQIDHWYFKSFEIVTNQTDLKSVAFLMYSLITWIICWKTVVNLHDFYSLNL